MSPWGWGGGGEKEEEEEERAFFIFNVRSFYFFQNIQLLKKDCSFLRI